MRREIQIFLYERPDLLNYIREQPYWYRWLSRDPTNIQKIENYAKEYYGKTFTQRVERVNHQLQMFSMLLSMIQGMRD